MDWSDYVWITVLSIIFVVVIWLNANIENDGL